MLAPHGQELLARIEQEYDGDNALTVSAQFPHADRSLVAACLTQSDLRRRAVSEFGVDASVMYFTPDGLEQATRRRVDVHRAARVARQRGVRIDPGALGNGWICPAII